jgi:hypothetical protein
MSSHVPLVTPFLPGSLGPVPQCDERSSQAAYAAAIAPSGKLLDMQRIAVVGSGGAGKSTFAAELGTCIGIPVIHLDRHYWKPGWVETPKEEWQELQRVLLAGENWIVDGNYGGTFDVRFSRADTLIVLSLPPWRCVLRALRRTLRHFVRPGRPSCGLSRTTRRRIPAMGMAISDR